MARHAQPNELAKLKGADKVNPGRYRKNIPKSKLPLGNPPDHLSDAAAECWFELSALALPGVLTGADRIVLEVASNYLAAYRTAWATPIEDGRRVCPFPSNHMAHLRGAMAEMGFSPSSRTKLGVESPKDDDDDFEV